MEENEEPFYEPENQTDCPNTGAQHVWLWDSEQQEYQCDECGVMHGNQE